MKRRFFGKQHENPTNAVSEGPSIEVVIAPKESVHSYFPRGVEQPITETPHFEMYGRSCDKAVGYGPLDKKTQQLYDAVHALHAGISNVSIDSGWLQVDGPERRRRNRDVSDWPSTLDTAIVRCLVQHLGLDDDVPFSVRKQNEYEARTKVDLNIVRAMVLGAKPPEGWVDKE